MNSFISPDLLLLIGTLLVFLLVISLYIWAIGREDKKQRARIRAASKWWQSADKKAPEPQPCAGCRTPIGLASTWYHPLERGPLCEDCYWKAKLTPRTTVANLAKSRGHQFDRHYIRDSGHTSVDFTEAATFGALASADDSSWAPTHVTVVGDSGPGGGSVDFSGGGGDFGGGGSSDSY